MKEESRFLVRQLLKLSFSFGRKDFVCCSISVGKARECKLESDCAGIQNTTCMADPRDGRTRCLCGDFSPPQNGACTNKFKGNQSLLNPFSVYFISGLLIAVPFATVVLQFARIKFENSMTRVPNTYIDVKLL